MSEVQAWTELKSGTGNVRIRSFTFSGFIQNSQLSSRQEKQDQSSQQTSSSQMQGVGPRQRFSHARAEKQTLQEEDTDLEASTHSASASRSWFAFVPLVPRGLVGSYAQVLGYSSECLPLSRREPWGPTSGPQCPGNWIPHLV